MTLTREQIETLRSGVKLLPLMTASVMPDNIDALCDMALRSLDREWQPIETAPKNEMFIWGYPKDGKFSIGLAYRTVSGPWRDAYGGSAPEHATYWMPLPEKP